MDPDKDYTFDLTNSPSTGPTDVPINIVEFSDFRCGFCTVNSHTLSEVAKLYPGKIRRVFKHFPIRMDAVGMLPHRASMAAMAQGKFWEMHEALMASQANASDDILQRAAAIGLDMDAFRNVLAASDPNVTMQRDLAEGDQLGIRSTPTTFVNGRYVSSSQSLESYRKLIDDTLGLETKERSSPELVLGPADASAWIDFYLDFSDPVSVEMAEVLTEFREERTDTRLHLKPILSNTETEFIHEALMAAAEQGKFWHLCQLIFAQDSLPNRAQLLAFAKSLELDTAPFAAALQDHRFLKAVRAEATKGQERGLEGSALFLNGERFEKELTARNLPRS
ncbi:MAG: protein-disulfide isomerase [Verrucomicrobiales bacterium]|jgi:protein-disulfide isomerase